MTNHEMDTCAEVSAELAELALGVLTGRERSIVVEHVENCDDCRAELEHLTGVADALLMVAPQAEPPLGFELRVAERVRTGLPTVTGRQPSEATPIRRRIGAASRWRKASGPQRRNTLLAAAALVVALALGGVGLVNSLGSGGTRPLQASVISAQLTSASGGNIGEVLLASGSPPMLVMEVNGGPWGQRVDCQVQLANGHVMTVGSFSLSGSGEGTWAIPLKVGLHEVQSARLVTSNGTVLAKAAL
ncbi:MAG: hypothetical protein JWM85_1834 [Acidimicrobiaceae bacterium]|nr:hypothetical protein [Acidimicrobiaceae bacterium]